MDPLTPEELRAWLTRHGVPAGSEMDAALDQFAGYTEDEMDAELAAQHGDMA